MSFFLENKAMNEIMKKAEEECLQEQSKRLSIRECKFKRLLLQHIWQIK